MTTPAGTSIKAFILIALGLAIAAMGLYVGEVDDAPGAGGIGLILMIAAVVLAVKTARNRLASWAWWTALTVGLVVTVLAALLTQGVAAARPLYTQAQTIPSASASTPASQFGEAVERAREVVRAAILEQNLPGVSVAVGTGGTIVWAEGFGWRDAGTRTPVTPATRFNIGTAAAVVSPVVARLELADTGADAAKEWSPEAIGEEGEDFPPFTMVRHLILQPLGLAAAEYPLPGERATFYVPIHENNPRLGRRLMYMRDLACCADGMAFYSTPSDLVRVGLATKPGRIDGELAGGTVTSLATGPDDLIVAVTANIAYANTTALAQRVAEAFGK